MLKKQTGIWIDGSKAIIVSLADGIEKVKEIDADIENRNYHYATDNQGKFSEGHHHINHEKKMEERKKHQIDDFIDEVMTYIKQDDELLVLGPGELKISLKKRIEKDGELFSKLMSVESADKMTDNQLVAKVRSFFRGCVH